jgi:nicotinate-nucleotide adenylyltransferase
MAERRIGVFGGTFDPPHNGHLLLAREALCALALERVLWVITPDPPHKQGRGISPLTMRLRLLQAALAGRSTDEISLVDVKRPGPQYAVDTLRLLQAEYPDTRLFYLMGGDSLHDLPSWYAPRELLKLSAGLGVLRRPDDRIDLPDLERRLPGISAKITFIPSPEVAISSTILRRRIQSGDPVADSLPTLVLDIIQSEKLYTGEPPPFCR